jgi:ABC-type multidrug transport system permease subunit
MRSMRDTVRNPVAFYARLAQFCIVGLFLGATYIPLGNDQASIQDRIGVLFFMTIGGVMLNANSIILTFPLERGLLIRDQYSGMYRVWTYFLGKMISELPFGIAVAMCVARRAAAAPRPDRAGRRAERRRA